MTTFAFLDALAALESDSGVIAFPTDTVYGIGCMVDHPAAIEKIYRMKGREEEKPLILLGCTEEAFDPYLDTTNVHKKARTWMIERWPGSLTLVLAKSGNLPKEVTRGMETVGIRVPDCESFRDFLAMVPGGVLATTSANRSGELPCLTADQVIRTFGDDLDYVITDDAAVSGTPSTVAAVLPDGQVRILRQGAVVLD